MKCIWNFFYLEFETFKKKSWKKKAVKFTKVFFLWIWAEKKIPRKEKRLLSLLKNLLI